MGAQVAKGQRWSLIPQQSDSEPLCSNYSRGPVSWYWSRDDRVDTSVKLSALRPQLDTDVTNKRYGFPPSSGSWNTLTLLIAAWEGRAEDCENLEKRRKVAGPSGGRGFCTLVSVCINWLFVHTEMGVKWCMFKHPCVSHNFMQSNAFVMSEVNFEPSNTTWMWSPMHYPRIKGEEDTVCTNQMVNAIQTKHKTCVFILGTGMKK